MSKRVLNIPMHHGMLNDTINYEELIKRDSENIIVEQGDSLKMKIGEEKDASKQLIYSARKTERSTQKDIYCGKRK